MIILVIGDYGVGKDTIVDILIDMIGKDLARKIKSWTTREPRYPEENTHEFFWWPESDIEYRNRVFEVEIRIPGHLAAYTKIGEAYYWTGRDQFGQKKYEFYITDKKGAADVIRNVDDDVIRNVDDGVFVLEIVRPMDLIDVDKKRLERKPFYKQPSIPIDYTFNNSFLNLTELRFALDVVRDHIVNF